MTSKSILKSVLIVALMFVAFVAAVPAQIDCGWGINLRAVGSQGEIIETAIFRIEGSRVPPRVSHEGFEWWGEPMGVGPSNENFVLSVTSDGRKPFESQIRFPYCDLRYYEVILADADNNEKSRMRNLYLLDLEVSITAVLRPFKKIVIRNDLGEKYSVSFADRRFRRVVVPPGDYIVEGQSFNDANVFVVLSRLGVRKNTRVDFGFPKLGTDLNSKPDIECERRSEEESWDSCKIKL